MFPRHAGFGDGTRVSESALQETFCECLGCAPFAPVLHGFCKNMFQGFSRAPGSNQKGTPIEAKECEGKPNEVRDKFDISYVHMCFIALTVFVVFEKLEHSTLGAFLHQWGTHAMC